MQVDRTSMLMQLAAASGPPSSPRMGRRGGGARGSLDEVLHPCPGLQRVANIKTFFRCSRCPGPFPTSRTFKQQSGTKNRSLGRDRDFGGPRTEQIKASGV